MNIVEVGASDYNNCITKQFIDKGQLFLIEPNPILYKDLVKGINSAPNVKLFNNAVSSFRGTCKFINWGLVSWLAGASSFMMLSTDLNGKTYNFEEYYDQLSTITEVFELDDLGLKIDYLSLNCNGSEMDILSSLKNFPSTIRCCYYAQSVLQSDYYKQITDWMWKTKYKRGMKRVNHLKTFAEAEFYR